MKLTEKILFNQIGGLQLAQRVVFPFNTITTEEITIDNYFERLYVHHGFTLIQPDGSEKKKQQFEIDNIGDSRLVITGAMGAGKSTFLLSLFNKTRKLYNDKHIGDEPILLNLTDLLKDVEVKKVLMEKTAATLFVDSLDESVMEFGDIKVKNAITYLLTFKSVVIACRTPFFYDFFDLGKRGQLSKILHLEPLSEEQQHHLLRKYLNDPYLKKISSNTASEETALQIIRKCKGGKTSENTIVATPLFTALTAIVATNTPSLHKMTGIVDVYQRFISDFAKRKFGDTKYIKELTEVAFNLNNANLKSDIIYLKDLSNDYGTKFSELIKDFVQIRNSSLTEEEIVIDFRHRSIGEYLIAKYIVNSMNHDDFSAIKILELFNRLYNYEISFFIRALFNELKLEVRDKIFTEFKNYIENNLQTQDFQEVMSLHNCIYFFAFSNKSGQQFAEKLANIFLNQKIKIHPLVFGTFLSGLISYGLFDLHAKLTNSNKSNDKNNLWKRNLNYHLFYYGDSEFKNPDDFIKNITKETKWDNTRSILIYRLESTDEKRIYFREFDLSALRHFIHKTKYNLSVSEKERIFNIISNSEEWIQNIENTTHRNRVIKELNLLSMILNIAKAKKVNTSMDKYKNKLKTNGNWDIGIITIVEPEKIAIDNILLSSNVEDGKKTIRKYTKGFLPGHDNHQHSVVMTQQLIQGNESVVAAYKDLVSEFKPKLMILFGIAGSISENNKLCDVCLVNQVIDYDKRKEGEKGKISERGSAYRVGAKLQVYLNEFFNTYGEFPRFKACDGSLESTFGVQAGPIGSGNAVVGNSASKIKIWLKNFNSKILAVETEAVGFSNTFYEEELNRNVSKIGALIIRGISDHADFEKDDKWRVMASKNAAFVLGEFVKLLPKLDTLLSK